MREIESAQVLSIPFMKSEPNPRDWFIRRLQKSLFNVLPIMEEEAIFLDHVIAVVLSERRSVLGWSTFGTKPKVSMASSTALYEIIIMTNSKQLIETS